MIGTSFQGMNILFVLSFKNGNDRTGQTGYVFSKLEIKDYNFMIDGWYVFDQPV